MENILSKATHTISAFIVASAIGALINAALVMLSYVVFTGPESHKIIDSYGNNNGVYFLIVTLILGLLFLPITIKLKLTKGDT
jgi:uncharacterized membrane protein YdjX (TVP38/TMEM64 family)